MHIYKYMPTDIIFNAIFHPAEANVDDEAGQRRQQAPSREVSDQNAVAPEKGIGRAHV